MTKILATALVALTATLMVASTASALSLKFPFKGTPKGEITSPGEAFQPFQQTADVAELCYEQGGELKKVFDGNDFVWVCVA